MPIKIKEPKTLQVEFDDMAGEHWIFEVFPIPDNILADLQANPEKILTDQRVIDFVKSVKGPIEGNIETEKDKEELKQAVSGFGGVISLLNTGILKAYMDALNKFARAEKNSQKH